MKRTDIGNTIRDIANESALSKAEAHSLRLIAKECDTLKASHDKLVKALKIYGHHGRTDDTTMCEHMKHSDYPCTCGLEQALKEAGELK